MATTCSWCNSYIADGTQYWELNIKIGGEQRKSQEKFCSLKCAHEYPYAATPEKTVIDETLEIINPHTGERLLVAGEDFKDQIQWNQAVIACTNLGNGWRLPTKAELVLMCNELHKKGVGNFKEAIYWSSAEHRNRLAWTLFFNDEVVSASYNKTSTFYVRAVRTF